MSTGTDASEADLAVLQHQLDTEEPLGADELSERIDATREDTQP